MPEKLLGIIFICRKDYCFLHHIVIDVVVGVGGGGGEAYNGKYLFERRRLFRKKCGIYKNKTFISYSLQENLKF